MNEQASAPPSLTELSALIENGAFEETLEALEAVVEHLERGRLTMDESIAWYEAGLGLSRRCSELLEQAELRISRLDAEYFGTTQSAPSWASEDSWNRDAQLRLSET
jgi:exodeoxyribonuclease VII small subunit